jgi:outer membrane lipoprotein-sorting protein
MLEIRISKLSLPLGLLVLTGGLVSSTLLLQPAALAQSVELHSPSESICAQTGGSDGKALLQAMQGKVRQMKNYTFDSILTTYKGKKVVVETGKFYFKSPNMVRFEVIKAGSRSGSVVIRQADGKIRGQMGGALRGIKVNLSPDSKLLKTANGFNILDSDLNTLLDSACRRAQAKSKCLAGAAKGVHIVELLEENGDLTDRIAVASQDKLPDEWNLYCDKQILSSVHFGNLQTRRNDLDNSLFVMGTESDSSKSLNDAIDNDNLRLEQLMIECKKNQSLSIEVFEQLNRVIGQIRQNAHLLKATLNEYAGADSGNQAWVGNSRARILVAAVNCEGAIDSLKTFADILQAQETLGGYDNGTSTAWRNAAVLCRASVSDLVESVEEDSANLPKLRKLTGGLTGALDTLNNMSKRGLDLI